MYLAADDAHNAAHLVENRHARDLGQAGDNALECVLRRASKDTPVIGAHDFGHTTCTPGRAEPVQGERTASAGLHHQVLHALPNHNHSSFTGDAWGIVQGSYYHTPWVPPHLELVRWCSPRPEPLTHRGDS